MHLPIIKGGSRYKKSTTYFGGINMLQDYSEGELCEFKLPRHNPKTKKRNSI